jgi:putative ABC transport system permease protein
MGGGRLLNDGDNAEKRHVAIVGWEMRKNLFPGVPAIGEIITLNGIRFQVVGYLDTVGQNEGNATNQRLYIPFSTMEELFPVVGQNYPEGTLSFINYKPVDRASHAEAVAQVKHIVARNHQFDENVADAFEIWDTAQNAESVGRIFTAMNMFLGSVGVVTLALGAIGVINIMLVSVKERTKEIGLRKALGATNRNVMAQFFLEGAFLTLLSGGIGIAAAAGFMRALSLVPAPRGFDTPQIVPWSIAMALGTLSFAGTVAGLYPARQAALLTPVEALRKD